jgi:RNA polymerase sigma-70 factor (ECF subfamily)
MEHRDELLNFATRIVRDRAGAEDVVQEAWFRFSAQSGQETAIEQPKSYLFTIVRNLAVDWLRRTAQSAVAVDPQEVLAGVPCEAPSAEQVLYYRDELKQLEAALSELPERAQIAFRLYRVDKKTLQEVADYLGVSIVAAHKLVKRATLHCAARIHGEEEKE